MATTIVNSASTKALEAGLQAAKIDHKNIGSAAEKIKLFNWLNAWITNGTEGLITDRISAAKALFQAKEGQAEGAHIQEIQNRMTAMETSFNALFEGMSSSSRGVLGVLHSAELGATGLVLDGVKGLRISSKDDSASLSKQMNMLMHQLIEQSEKHAMSSENQGLAFSKKLEELVKLNAHSFTNEFLGQFKVTIEERQEELPLDTLIYKERGSKDALGLLKMTKDDKPLITIEGREKSLNQIYEMWNELKPGDRAKAQQDGILFFTKVSDGQLNGLAEADKTVAIQSEMGKLSAEAKLFVQIKTREHENTINLQKHGTDIKELLSKMFGEGFFSKALVTAVMGFFGGSILGSPLIGVFLTTVVSLLGSLSEDSKPKLAPPELQAANSRSTKLAP